MVVKVHFVRQKKYKSENQIEKWTKPKIWKVEKENKQWVPWHKGLRQVEKVKDSCQRSFCASADMKIITLEKGPGLITANWASPGILNTTIVLTKTTPFCLKLNLWTKIDTNVWLIVAHWNHSAWTCLSTKYFNFKTHLFNDVYDFGYSYLHINMEKTKIYIFSGWAQRTHLSFNQFITYI